MFHASESELPEAEEALYKTIVPLNKKRAIQLEDFADLYDREQLAKDEAYVAKFEAKFEEEGKGREASRKYGELFEAIVNDQIENADLMGPRASVIVPSRFDDIQRGVDSIVQFKQEKGATSHLALAIDVTKSQLDVGQKFERVRKSIDDGELTKVKYFKTKNYRGELGPVARVVVGADHAVSEDISNLMLQFMRLKDTVAKRRAAGEDPDAFREYALRLAKVRRQLASHPLQEIVLTEIRAQLEAFQEYARSRGKEDIEREYEKIIHIVDEVIAEKDAPSNPNKEIVDNDEMYKLIMDNAKNFNIRARAEH